MSTNHIILEGSGSGFQRRLNLSECLGSYRKRVNIYFLDSALKLLVTCECNRPDCEKRSPRTIITLLNLYLAA